MESVKVRVLDRMTEGDLERALLSLPERFLTPITLADIEGFTYREIAEFMGVPIGKAVSRLHRSRTRFRRRVVREVLVRERRRAWL